MPPTRVTRPAGRVSPVATALAVLVPSPAFHRASRLFVVRTVLQDVRGVWVLVGGAVQSPAWQTGSGPIGGERCPGENIHAPRLSRLSCGVGPPVPPGGGSAVSPRH